jgi:hypothetical protein
LKGFTVNIAGKYVKACAIKIVVEEEVVYRRKLERIKHGGKTKIF